VHFVSKIVKPDLTVLFVDYLNTFMKLKAEASSYPSWVRTPNDEETYIEIFCLDKDYRT
jgi:hypothetical protein